MGDVSPGESAAVGAERDDVDRAESVLRRIHRRQYEERDADPILRTAFQPSRSDTDGLSLHRERLCTVRELVEYAPQPATEYYVVRIAVADLLEAGFTLRPDPLPPPGLPGHVLIPEITFDRSKETRHLQLALAELANRRGQIVWRRGPVAPSSSG